MWKFEHEDVKKSNPSEALYTFTVYLQHHKVYVGFDRVLCVRVFERIADDCESALMMTQLVL